MGVFREDVGDYGAGFCEGYAAVVGNYGGCFERVEGFEFGGGEEGGAGVDFEVVGEG